MRSKKHYVIYQDCYCFISLNKKWKKYFFPCFFFQINRRRRTYNEAFPDDDDDDEWVFDPALDHVMVGGGAATTLLLEFDLQPVGAWRNWRNVLNRQRFEATLRLRRDIAPTDNLGQELTHALQRSIEQQIAADRTLTPHSTVHFTMQSNAFTHAYQSTTFTVREFEEGSERLDTYLQALASKLNSNEEFTPDDTFTVETTFICTPGPGRGHGKRYRPSKAAVRGIVKKSRVTIKDKDNLCCTRAIVTMKALVDADGNTQDRDYKNLKQGYPVQERLAKELHRLAEVPEGPCGLPELEQFQIALPGYQIKVMSIDPPNMIIYAGSLLSDKIIRPIKEDDHYDGCNSFAGFFSRSYFCDECNKGFDHDNFTHHSCHGKWCPACKRDDCPDFIEAKQPLARGRYPTPTFLCQLCHRKFFGDQCYNYHLQRRSPHQVHLRLLQKVSAMLPRLRIRPRDTTQCRSPMWVGRMSHLRKEGPPSHTPMLHSTPPGRCGRPQKETHLSR